MKKEAGVGPFFKKSTSFLNDMTVVNIFVIAHCFQVQKFFSTKFFSWDLELYDAERDIPATSNTSDVNEELGLITHLFTDKTG